MEEMEAQYFCNEQEDLEMDDIMFDPIEEDEV